MEQAAEMMHISRGTLYNKVNKDPLEDDFVQSVHDDLGIILNEPDTPYYVQRRNLKNNGDVYLVPFVDVPAQAGYVQSYSQTDFIAKLKHFPILPGVDPVGADWRYFEIKGDSMEPEFMAGDHILCSQVIREDWSSVKEKNTHVIVTEKEIWIKDVNKYSVDLWVLLSQNPAYKPFKISVSEIRQVWVMRRHVKNRAKKHRMYDMDEVYKELGL